ncbi:copper oxidase [bacterium]|nr:copper oxidase [bacterium]
MSSRRDFMRGAFITAGAFFSGLRGGNAQHQGHQDTEPKPPRKQTASRNRTGYSPVETPDVPKMTWTMESGVKVFHITAEVVKTEFIPGRQVYAWGYNGSVPGPTIEVVEGDRCRLILHNKLPEPTTIHWHGFEIPINMDGMPAISQPLVNPGESFTYEFTVRQKGTFFYHSHMAMQEMMGMIGLFIMHPKKEFQPAVDKDFGIIVQEWALLPNNPIPNTLSMEFNWLTMNGKAAPATTPMIVKLGDRVRIRFVNLGMDHHPMHLHGNTFYVTGTEGGRVPRSAWTPANTVLVGVAQARDVEFDAVYPGDWMVHCHLPHHMMNQMVSMVGPMTHMGHGMHSGMGMEEGMGMIREGSATDEELGPSFGRALGVGSTFEEKVGHLVGQKQTDHSQHQMQSKQMDPKKVPGYPQDMHMVMDETVEKPETYGLAKGWTGGMMGMMSLVRVLEPGLYAKVKELQAQGRKNQKSPEPHKHG